MDYRHPYESMRRLALALRYDCNRTRHAYYRQMRLIHEHFGCDPEPLTEAQLREYFLFVKLQKEWQPKTIRQAAGAARMFFVRMLGRTDWTLFSQIRARDHDRLPPVLSREQVRRLIGHIRLRRYRTPIKLIYCCGLRLTFTLPAQLRGCFFGPHAKEAYDLFFAAVAGALSEKLATDKGLRAWVNGFTAVLHTWNQRLMFHSHIHCLVPGAGLDEVGNLVRVAQVELLVYLPHLQAAFRQRMRRELDARGWQVDPQVWTLDWGVQIQPVGSGAAAVKYSGAYVARTAIGDARIQQLSEQSVTFRWRDRADGNRLKTMTLPGVQFVSRYLRHVLPVGLRSIRYYGFCHPAAKANRLRIQLLAGMHVDFGAEESRKAPTPVPCCAFCQGPLRLIASFQSPYRQRGPPRIRPPPAPEKLSHVEENGDYLGLEELRIRHA